MRTSRTDLPIVLTRGTISYLCNEDHHERCSGLTCAGLLRPDLGTELTARLCGCLACDCNDRVRATLDTES